MRRVTFVAATLALLMLMTLPAQAKVAGEANISGPGLPGGGSINLDGSDGAGWAAFSGLLDVGAAGMEEPPTKDLGPRYEVVLDVRQPSQTKDIVQHLYPYAEGGPLLYTPPGQELLDFEAPSGWASATTDLMDLLHEAGLPESAPVPEPVTGPAARPDVRVAAPDEVPPRSCGPSPASRDSRWWQRWPSAGGSEAWRPLGNGCLLEGRPLAEGGPPSRG